MLIYKNGMYSYWYGIKRIVLGENEKNGGAVAVRKRGEGDLGSSNVLEIAD
jgi:hypothetical protein